jgi:hypothetical protein
MAKERNDFVKIKPTEGHGSASYTAGYMSVFATREDPAEVTRGEWLAILKNKGIFELCEPEDDKK